MSAKIINCKDLSQNLLENIKKEVTQNKYNINLNIILIGNNEASKVYINNKIKAANSVGINANLIQFEEDIKQQELVDYILKLNTDSNIHGIIVQLPLPPKINPYEIILSIDPKKDVDGFHPENAGKLSIGIDSLYPCTAIGVLEILKSIKCDLQNSHIAVLGRSNIVGRPLAHLLEKQNATVTLCHSFTKNLHEITSRCDVLISAIGKSNFITDKYVKNGAIVIDVGINFIHKEGKKILTGDIDFESVSKVASLITTVPGGVGPMTVSCLIANTLKAFKIQKDQVS